MKLGSRGFGEIDPRIENGPAGLGVARVERQYACDEDLSVTGHRAPRLEKNPGARPGRRSVVGFHLLDDTPHILAMLMVASGTGAGMGAWNAMESLRSNSDIPATVGVARLPPKSRMANSTPSSFLHPIGKCQHLADVSMHLLGATQHAAHMAVDGGELQYATFVHLLDGCKRLTGSDGQPELPAPSRGSGDAYADTRAFAQRARRRSYDVNLLPVVDVEQKELRPTASCMEAIDFAGPLKTMRSGGTPSFKASQSSYSEMTSAPMPDAWNEAQNAGNGVALVGIVDFCARAARPVDSEKLGRYSPAAARPAPHVVANPTPRVAPQG